MRPLLGRNRPEICVDLGRPKICVGSQPFSPQDMRELMQIRPDICVRSAPLPFPSRPTTQCCARATFRMSAGVPFSCTGKPYTRPSHALISFGAIRGQHVLQRFPETFDLVSQIQIDLDSAIVPFLNCSYRSAVRPRVLKLPCRRVALSGTLL